METPELPGDDLETAGIAEGTVIYDPDNSDAWVAGETVTLGVDPE